MSPAEKKKEAEDEKFMKWKLEHLKNNWAIEKLTDDQRQHLAEKLFSKNFKAGEKIIVEGEAGEYFFLLQEGKAEVSKYMQEEGKEKFVCVLEKGSTFGELALLYDTARSSTVTAKTDVKLQAIRSHTLKHLFTGSATAFHANFLKQVKLLEGLDSWELAHISQKMKAESRKKGQTVLQEGDSGHKFFMIVEGTAHATVGGNVVKTYDNEGFFGELALLQDAPRKASVIALSELKLLSLEKQDFQNVLGYRYKHLHKQTLKEYGEAAAHPRRHTRFNSVAININQEEADQEKLKGILQTKIASNMLLRRLNIILQSRLIEHSFARTYANNDLIIEEGKFGDFFYVLEEGEVEVLEKNDTGNMEVKGTVADTFGELAVLYNVRRSCSIRAKGKVTAHLIDCESVRHICDESEHVDFVKFLRSVEVLNSSLTLWQLVQLSVHIEELEFKDGEAILEEGKVDDKCYVIAKGGARETQTGVEYGPGDFFDVMTLLKDDHEALSNVIAMDQTIVYTLQKSAVLVTLGDHCPKFQQEARKAHERKVASQVEHRQWLAKSLGDNWILKDLTDQQREQLVLNGTRKEVNDKSILHEGDESDELYIVEAGEVEITTKSQLYPRTVSGKGSSFGEIASLFGQKRVCSVRAIGVATVFCIKGSVLKKVIADTPIASVVQRMGTLRAVALFKDLSVWELARLSHALVVERFQDGEVVIKEGDKGDKFYLVDSGKAKATVKGKVVKEYDGGFFGELALLESSVRAASVVADGDLMLLSLDKVTFQNVMGSLYAELHKQAMETYNFQVDEEEETRKTESMLKALNQNWALQHLREETKTSLAANMYTKTFKKDEVIIQQGKADSFFYVLEKGKVILIDESDNGRTIKELQEGASFGELSLLFGEKRTCTVKAVDDNVIVQCLTVDHFPDDYKNHIAIERIHHLKTVPLLKDLGLWDLANAAQCMEVLEFKEGETVIRQGDIGDKFYVIKEGHARALIDDHVVKEYDSHGYFGELSLLENIPTPRKASVLAASKLVTLTLDKPTFKRVLDDHYAEFRKSALQDIRNAELARREALVDEIIQSEFLYSTFLGILVEHFLEPIQDEGLLGEKEIQVVFSNVEEILNIHDIMYNDMMEDRNIPGTLLKHKKELEAYAIYVGGHAEALSEVRNQTTNLEFQEFLADKRHDKETTGGLTLKAYLKMPIQRIARIRLLLVELAKCTPSDHPESEQIEKAITAIKDISAMSRKKKRVRPHAIKSELNFWQQFRQITGGVGYEEGVTMLSDDVRSSTQLNLVRDHAREEKHLQDKEVFLRALERNWATSQLSGELQEKLFKENDTTVVYTPGEIIVEMLAAADNFYVLTKGEAIVCLPDDNKELKERSTVEPGRGFGEIAILFNSARTCTIKAKTRCEVYTIPKDPFLEIFDDSNVISKVNTIKKVELFDNLAIWDLARLSQAMEKQTFAAGDSVIKQGDTGDRFYFIVDGDAEALVDGKVVKEYQAGGYFGELALLADCPRAASVVAKTGLKVMHLHQDRFRSVLGPQYNTLWEEAVDRYDLKRDEKKKAETHKWLLDTFETNWLIVKLDAEKKDHLAHQTFVLHYHHGDYVIEQGGVGDMFYVVESGELEVLVQTEDGDTKVVSHLQRGSTFGELAVLYHTSRTSSVRALTDVVVHCFSEAAILKAFEGTNITQYAGFLRELKLLGELEIWELARLSQRLTESKYNDKDKIITQGEIDDKFFILYEGCASALVDGKTCAKYHTGGCFGELALLEDELSPRAADVVADGPCTVFSVDQTTFKKVLDKVYVAFREHSFKVRAEQKAEVERKKKLMMDALGAHWATKCLSRDICETLLHTGIEKTLGDVDGSICEVGGEGDFFYIVMEGEALVWVDKLRGASRVVEAGNCFGELSIIFEDTKRSCSVVAEQAITCLCIPREAMREAFASSSLVTRKSLVQSVPLFSQDKQPLKLWDLARLAAATETRTFADGDVIVAKGQAVSEVLLLESGDWKLEGGGGLANGVYMERALYDSDVVAEGQLVAVGATSVAALSKSAVMNILEHAYNKLAGAHCQAIMKAKQDWLMKVLDENWLVKKLSEDQKQALITKMFTRTFVAGDVICEQGKQGDLFYVVEEGEVEVRMEQEGVESVVNSLGKAASFGELSVLYKKKRTASVIAKTKVVAQATRETDLRKAFGDTNVTAHCEYLMDTKILSKLTLWELARVSEALVLEEFKDGEFVMQEGDIDDKFYLVKDGMATVVKEGQVVKTHNVGVGFGELALLDSKQTKRKTSIKVEGPTRLLSVTKEQFQTVLGKTYTSFCDAILKEKRDKLLKKRAQVVEEFMQSETLYSNFLHILVEQFMFPIRHLHHITEEHVSKIFSNVESIAEVHSLISAALCSTRDIPGTFLKFADYLKCYSMYVGNFDNAMEQLSAFKKHKQFQKFLVDKRSDKENTGGLDLMSYLIMPIQRIPRYRMLLAEVLKYTPEDHETYEPLSKALEKIKLIASYVNEKKRDVEDTANLLRVIKLILGKTPEPLIQPNRKVIAEFYQVQKQGKKKVYWMFCFNDLLVVTQKTGQFKRSVHYAHAHLSLKMNVVENKIEGLNIHQLEPEGDTQHGRRSNSSATLGPIAYTFMDPDAHTLHLAELVVETAASARASRQVKAPHSHFHTGLNIVKED